MSEPDVTPPPPPARPAATVIVVREGPQGPQVLMVERAAAPDQYGGAWVFPGGRVEALDEALHPGQAHPVAAIRECFEEAGILFAYDRLGQLVDGAHPDFAALAAQRLALAEGRLTLADLCGRHGLRLAPDRLRHFAHRITPLARPKRFDTHFYVAPLPPGQQAETDGREIVGHDWLRPAEALASGETRKLMTVTRDMLEAIGRFGSVEALMESLGA